MQYMPERHDPHLTYVSKAKKGGVVHALRLHLKNILRNTVLIVHFLRFTFCSLNMT